MTKNTINKVKHKQETGKRICNSYHKIGLTFPLNKFPTDH